MAYTVNKLAKLSGVSARTLRFYDEIGLLKPAYVGDNDYRYYEEEQLLMLQQILFYRELDFPLAEIQRIMSSDHFDKIEALESHKCILMKELDRTSQMIRTIDKTISHLRGKEKMKNEELYYGFDSEKQKKHEKYLVEKGIVTQQFINESNAKIKDWSDEQKRSFITDMEGIITDLIVEMEKKSQPDDESVQALMRKHYTWLELTWTPNRESYIGLSELYQTPEFRKFYDDRHPELLDFFVKAMKIFAERELSCRKRK
ncbi:MAG TPA: MerR family transcriptional regulator [Gammaproteobacteria bacterium]|nr:MerR family transcriptional regulator [Gammaproteobacteria bacterium]